MLHMLGIGSEPGQSAVPIDLPEESPYCAKGNQAIESLEIRGHGLKPGTR
jgi:hypothetical protein